MRGNARGNVAAQRQPGQFGRQRRVASGLCTPFKGVELRLSRCVKIVGRNGRIILALAGQEAGEVAHIFPLQRQGVIFGWPWKKMKRLSNCLANISTPAASERVSTW